MATPIKKQEVTKQSRSLSLALKGIRTVDDFNDVMSALMTDMLSGDVTPDIGNAVVNAGGKLLKAAMLREKYGTRTQGGRSAGLILARLSEPE
jgi:hypothetical protein